MSSPRVARPPAWFWFTVLWVTGLVALGATLIRVAATIDNSLVGFIGVVALIAAAGCVLQEIDRRVSSQPAYVVTVTRLKGGIYLWSATFRHYDGSPKLVTTEVASGSADSLDDAREAGNRAARCHRSNLETNTAVDTFRFPVTDLDPCDVDDMRARVDEYHAEQTERGFDW